MAKVIKESGTKIVTPQGLTTLNSPNNEVQFDTPVTRALEDLIVNANATVNNSLDVKGQAKVELIENSTSTFTGALIVTGGVGIGRDLQVGGKTIITGTITVVGTTSTLFIKETDDNVGNPFGNPLPLTVYGEDIVGRALADAERQEGAVFIAGGVGIQKDLNVGGFIYGRVAQANTSLAQVVTATNADAIFYPNFSAASTGFSQIYVDDTSVDPTDGVTPIPGGLRYNPYQGKLYADRVRVTSGETSTGTSSGAVVVEGGVGISDNLYVGTFGEIDNLYTKLIQSRSGNIEINPAGGVTQIDSEIRVLGRNPIGTAPVVSNTLYVTMDGDDTNDGRAEDPSRACRTIGGALKSPYYQPGTQIRVAAGHYLEDNPLPLKPYTSVMGSDIRTTSIEPINKTQDLFHLNSGCYLAFMQFLNGRSGLLEGPYLSEYNRGAYCTCFPPLEGDDRIDLYHSPYVQNCTNLSGPWLKDGTMFVPNQTVQIPLAVGSGSWLANTSTILVNVSTGTITQGMKINAGPQTPGFFNARTLMLANKPFLQEQVVAYVDQTFNSGVPFVYNTSSCYRDTGLIIDSIAIDLLQDSISESTFAGLQYWNQNGYTGSINEEILATIDSIVHVKDLTVTEVSNATDPGTAGLVSGIFDVILNILNVGTANITDTIVSNSTATNDATIITAYEAIQDAKTTITTSTIAWINTQIDNNIGNFPISFSYDQVKCARDIGYILDSVSFDLLHGGNKQSVKAGVYYYGFDENSTAIPNEIPQTTAAYNFIKSIVSNIVKAEPIVNTYQTGTVQVTALDSASDYEVTSLKNKIDIITNIIRNGPDAAGERTPIDLITNNSTAVLNAYNLLMANRTFIQEEVLAYLSTQFVSFDYSREKCYRDVGIIVENISYDASFGGNEKAVQSGLAYYDGVVSRIAGQETQTISAIDYLNYLVQKVIRNEVCPDLLFYGSGTTAQNAQVINTALVDGQVASRSLTDLFNIVTRIIGNGPSFAPNIYKGTNVDAAFVSAEVLMQANRTFIQQETINWVNETFRSFSYSKIKCRRDTGLIVDSLAFDLLYPTPGFSQSTFAGLQYWNQNGYVATIEDEINPTVEAVKYLKDLSVKIIRNITPADDLVPRYQTTATQVTTLESATLSEVATIQSEFDIIISILKGNSTGWTDKIVPNGNLTTLLGVQNAYNLLMANKDYMAREVTAYIDATNEGFVYDVTKCQRDVGYMIDAVGFDLLHTGNRQAIQAGLYYYGFDTSNISIRNQEIQTTDAFTYLGSIASAIVQNIEVTPLQTRVSQVMNLPAGDALSGSILVQAASTITNLITNGPEVDYNFTKIAMTATSTATVVNAFNLLLANKKFITEQVIEYIDNTYNSTPFSYDQVKCARDTGLIVDSIATDLYFQSDSESVFAGLQYWAQNGYTGRISSEVTTTTQAIAHAKTLAVAVVNGAGGVNPATTVGDRFDLVNNIILTGTDGVTDDIVSNDTPSTDANTIAGYNALIAAKETIQFQTIDWINSTYPSYVYNTSTCFRDIGFIIDSVAFDLRNGGNKQSIKSGVYYYNYDANTTEIPNEIPQTSAAYNFIEDIVANIVKGQKLIRTFQTGTEQVLFLDPATDIEAAELERRLSIITDIIENGPSAAPAKVPMNQTPDPDPNVARAYTYLKANRDFIIAETLAFIDATFSTKSFSYDEELCYRDTGLIVDAVSQDILLGGNYKSIEAGLAYWNFGYNHVTGQETTTTMALNYARDVALKVIANQPVTPRRGTSVEQVINPFFQYGGDYMPQEAVKRNFNIITTIIENGPIYAPPRYMGGGLFAMTGVNGADVLLPAEVASVQQVGDTSYIIGLNTSTVGFGNNATLYFGDTLVFPYQNSQVEEISLAYTGSTSTWDLRKVDPIGGMGGSLVDGAVISSRSPIQSFVYDAFTQLTQGGRGVRVTNDGYAQLVSVFTIFASTGVQVDNGGIASIVNSNANFGDICLVAKGYGKRKFTGTIYNPPFKAYPDSPGPEGLNQYYPEGFWPNNARVEVFLPDTDDRPHISLVMELEPPETYVNEQGIPGFLNATPSIATLATGTITITGIDTDNIAIGNTVYVRDENGSYIGSDGNYYTTGTTVSEIGYRSVTLSRATESGGGDPANPNYFTVLFAGNAYYTVLSSQIANNPKTEGVNILSSEATGADISQVPLHIASLKYLNSLTNAIITNQSVASLQTTATSYQTLLPLVLGGNGSIPFIDLRFDELERIIEAPNVAAAEAIIPKPLRTRTGTIPAGAGSAVTLIEANIDFLADEIVAYVDQNGPLQSTFVYDEAICRRDAGYVIEGVTYDMALGTNYNAVTCGNAYQRGIASSQAVIETELAQTLAAFNYLKDRTETLVSTSPIAVQRVTNSYQELMEILENGTEFADTLSFATPAGVDLNKLYAKNLLVANREFMKAEIIAWISDQIAGPTLPFTPSFTYDAVKCSRDVGYMIDALCYDILYGGNSASYDSARAYFSYAVSVLPPGETDPTVAAITRLAAVAQEIIQNITVTKSTGNSASQVVLGNSASVTEVNKIDDLLQLVRDAITAGTLSVLPTKDYPDLGWTSGTIQGLVSNIQAEQVNLVDDMVAFINDEFTGTFSYDRTKCRRDVKITLQRLIYDLQTGGRYNMVMAGLSYWSRYGTHHIVDLGENVRRTDLFPDGATINFYQRSYISASGYVFEYVGAGTNYGALPQFGIADPVQGKETVQLDSGKVFFTSTDQNGDFRIGPGLVISQATGVLSGRTFTKSLFANLTPFILAIEGAV